MNENEIFYPSKPVDELDSFIEQRFAGLNVDPENMGFSYVPNVGHVASVITNDDRRNAVAPWNFTASNFPRTKMLQKAVIFGFVERLVYI